MRSLFRVFIVCLFLILTAAALKAADPSPKERMVYHHLKVVLQPDDHRLSVEDTITLPDSHLSGFRFFLHSGLELVSLTPGVSIVHQAGETGVESFKVKLSRGINTFVVSYHGRISHPVGPADKEQSRGFNQTPGLISAEGVYLAGSSYWYPVTADLLVKFDMEIELPPEWDAVSQGERTLHVKGKDAVRVRWESPEPQEEIYIAAARFTGYEKLSGRVLNMVYLRSPDKELAGKYLEAASRYISMYARLIGPYPFKKFALVENFWETGYGMPSFTLLGPKIIRFPFIINSSYPHEILHNWWGNSVFPDYGSGNWSEGLTAYLSDHLIKETQGGGAEYRLSTLQKYADYVSGGRDFPLTGFLSRHSSSSEAIGYGKALMFFHMLRLELGDKDFTTGLRDFFREKRFQFASFSDLEKSFERISQKKLKGEFEQWVTRTGAAEIRLDDVRAIRDGEGYRLTATIKQVQSGNAYHLRIPAAVTMEGWEEAFQTVAEMDQKSLGLQLSLPARPVRIDLDPEYDLFRRLDRGEIPAAVSQALGAKRMLVLLPSSAGRGLLDAYRGFGRMLENSGPHEVEILLDKEVDSLPSDRAVTIMGWENRFSKDMISVMSKYDVTIDRKNIRIENLDIPKHNHSFVLTARNPKNRDMAVMFIVSDKPEALPGLGRKLPHYHKYSYLAFEGSEPENMAKGRWPVIDSPLTVFLPGGEGRGPKVEMARLVKREPLANLPLPFSGERMAETIRFLSSDDLKGRGFGTGGLDRAAEYIAAKFREAGLKPAGDKEGSYFQTWEDSGGDPERRVKIRNVIGVIPGMRREFSGQSVVIGAHYDHLGLGWPVTGVGNKGKVYPGADDNASGVAVLIELARVLGETLKPDRSIVFAAFTGEEAGKRGSRYYVANEKLYPPDKCISMLNLDTVGRLGKKKLLVLNGASAKEWGQIFRGAGYVTGVDLEMVTEELDPSDQTSFLEAGVPAVQFFSGPHPDYHRPTDTPDKIDPDGLIKVSLIAKEVIEYLSGREGPLTASTRQRKSEGPPPSAERQVSLGTIPDFAFSGKGYRLSGVIPGSAAEACGLREGDILTRINALVVGGIKDLSQILKSLSPGSRISVTFLRNGREMTVETVVKER